MNAIARSFVMATALAVLASACSSIPPRARMADKLQEYQAAAGEPVDSVRYTRLRSWEPLGERHVLIQMGPRKLYLVSLDHPCPELPWANSISVTSSTGRVHALFDNVQVRDQRCRIGQIQPIDTDLLAKARSQDSGGT